MDKSPIRQFIDSIDATLSHSHSLGERIARAFCSTLAPYLSDEVALRISHLSREYRRAMTEERLRMGLTGGRTIGSSEARMGGDGEIFYMMNSIVGIKNFVSAFNSSSLAGVRLCVERMGGDTRIGEEYILHFGPIPYIKMVSESGFDLQDLDSPSSGDLGWPSLAYLASLLSFRLGRLKTGLRFWRSVIHPDPVQIRIAIEAFVRGDFSGERIDWTKYADDGQTWADLLTSFVKSAYADYVYYMGPPSELPLKVISLRCLPAIRYLVTKLSPSNMPSIFAAIIRTRSVPLIRWCFNNRVIPLAKEGHPWFRPDLTTLCLLSGSISIAKEWFQKCPPPERDWPENIPPEVISFASRAIVYCCGRYHTILPPAEYCSVKPSSATYSADTPWPMTDREAVSDILDARYRERYGHTPSSAPVSPALSLSRGLDRLRLEFDMLQAPISPGLPKSSDSYIPSFSSRPAPVKIASLGWFQTKEMNEWLLANGEEATRLNGLFEWFDDPDVWEMILYRAFQSLSGIASPMSVSEKRRVERAIYTPLPPPPGSFDVTLYPSHYHPPSHLSPWCRPDLGPADRPTPEKDSRRRERSRRKEGPRKKDWTKNMTKGNKWTKPSKGVYRR